MMGAGGCQVIFTIVAKEGRDRGRACDVFDGGCLPFSTGRTGSAGRLTPLGPVARCRMASRPKGVHRPGAAGHDRQETDRALSVVEKAIDRPVPISQSIGKLLELGFAVKKDIDEFRQSRRKLPGEPVTLN